MAIPGEILGAGRCRREQDARQREHAGNALQAAPNVCAFPCCMPILPWPAPRVRPACRRGFVRLSSPANSFGFLRASGSFGFFGTFWPCPPVRPWPTGTATLSGPWRGPQARATDAGRLVISNCREIPGALGFLRLFDTGARQNGCCGSRTLGWGPNGTVTHANSPRFLPHSGSFGFSASRATRGAEASCGAAQFGSMWQRRS